MLIRHATTASKLASATGNASATPQIARASPTFLRHDELRYDGSTPTTDAPVDDAKRATWPSPHPTSSAFAAPLSCVATIGSICSWYKGWGRTSVHGFDSTTGQLVFAGLGQMDPRVAQTDRNNPSPRAGVAWRPAALRDTVVRAGAGIYYSGMPWVLELYPLALGSPSSGGVPFANRPGSVLPVYQLGLNVFPPAPANAITPGYAASLPAGTQITALDTAFRTAYTSQWNVSFERQLSPADSLEVSYVGSSAHRLPALTDLSQCRPGPDLLCSAATKPWPLYGLIYWVTSAGNASSHAMISRYSPDGSRAQLPFRIHVRQNALRCVGVDALAARSIAACRACDKAPATFDVRSPPVGSLVWEVPYWRRRAFGSWSLSAITTFATGQPIPMSGPNQTGTLFLNHLPNRVCDGRDNRLSGNIRSNGFVWFDYCPLPQPGSGVTSATQRQRRSMVPGVNNWDLGLSKLNPLPRIVQRAVPCGVLQRLEPRSIHAAGRQFCQYRDLRRISASRPPRLIQLGTKLLW